MDRIAEKSAAPSYALSARRLRPEVVLAAVVAALLLIFPLVFHNPYPQQLMIFVFLSAILGTGWNIIGGYAGQPALGNVVFFGLGAYSSGFILAHFYITPWVGLLVGMLVASAVAVVTGYPCFRLRGHYFAIATLAISLIALQLFRIWDVVGAAPGLHLPILDEGLATLEFHSSKSPYYYLFLGLLALAVGVSWAIGRSKPGYYLRAIRADQAAAWSVGIAVQRYKLLAYVISAAITAAAGSLYAQLTLFVEPDSAFAMLLSIQAALVTMLGGVGTLWGPLAGALILTGVGELTRTTLGGGGGAADVGLYGLLIVLFAAFEPRGLAGLIQRLRARRRRAR